MQEIIMQTMLPLEDQQQALRDLIAMTKEILPGLDANLGAASNEHLTGHLANGAFQAILRRHNNACILSSDKVSCDFDNPIQYFMVAAPITIDMRSAIKDNFLSQEQLDRWLEIFTRVGYTRMHRLFDIPIPEEE
jgi:hypothetical protein